MIRYVGLGRHCESTYQLRRITGDDRANYFDWLDLDHHALIAVLQNDFEGFLQLDDLVRDDEGKCVLDRRSGVRYYHDFTDGDLESQLAAVQQKFAFLASRWREMEDSDDTIRYVLHDALDEMGVEDALRVESVLRKRCSSAAMLWIRRTPPPRTKLQWEVITASPGRWQGDDAQWNKVFQLW